jgi:hypothetical protein
MEVLPLLWCGRQSLEIFLHFVLASRNRGFIFALSNVRHIARSHTLDNISKKLEANVIGLLCAC